jgi:hypothetical protein
MVLTMVPYFSKTNYLTEFQDPALKGISIVSTYINSVSPTSEVCALILLMAGN